MASAPDVYGQFVLEGWRDLPAMSIVEQKRFRGSQRVAVGGRTSQDGEDDDLSENVADDAETGDIEILDIGGGRGASKTIPLTTFQPNVYHEITVAFWEGVLLAVNGNSIIDLTPQPGRLAISCVTKNTSAMSVCVPQRRSANTARRLWGAPS